METKKEHNCFVYCGKISDVCYIINEKSITCRRCGKRLEEGEVDSSIWKQIQMKFELVNKK